MIYFFYGDKTTIHKKASKLFESLRAKKPDASFLSFDAENFKTENILELVSGQGLFEKKVVAFLKNILSEANIEDGDREEIAKKIKEIADSENIFIWTEYKILKEALTLLKKYSEKSDIVEEKAKTKLPEFNMFSLAEAFGNRDKKNLWVLFQKARKKDSAEAIHGILFWQLKTIALASVSKSADEADLKPFPFSNAKRFSKNYSLEEIKKLSQELIKIYHDAHMGKGDLDIALEKFILSL